jgi:hypothetical protein
LKALDGPGDDIINNLLIKFNRSIIAYQKEVPRKLRNASASEIIVSDESSSESIDKNSLVPRNMKFAIMKIKL